MTLASGGSPMFPLVVHQPASLASSAVTPAGSLHKSRGDNVVLLVCGGGLRSILLLPLLARCLETIDVCIWRMFVV